MCVNEKLVLNLSNSDIFVNLSIKSTINSNFLPKLADDDIKKSSTTQRRTKIFSVALSLAHPRLFSFCSNVPFVINTGRGWFYILFKNVSAAVISQSYLNFIRQEILCIFSVLNYDFSLEKKNKFD